MFRAIMKDIPMPGIDIGDSEALKDIADGFHQSRSNPNPLYGCVAALDGVAIAISKPPDYYVPRTFLCVWIGETSRKRRDCSRFLDCRRRSIRLHQRRHRSLVKFSAERRNLPGCLQFLSQLNAHSRGASIWHSCSKMGRSVATAIIPFGR